MERGVGEDGLEYNRMRALHTHCVCARCLGEGWNGAWELWGHGLGVGVGLGWDGIG